MHPNTTAWRAQLAAGITLAFMAVTAMGVDLVNNTVYGWSISAQMAVILGLAALGVVALPTAASALGWSKHLRLATFVCVALTVWAAFHAYSAKQDGSILKTETSQVSYVSARADADAARADLKRITELGDVGELQSLITQAKAASERACWNRWSATCEPAKQKVEALTTRLSDAKARDKLTAKLAEAQQKLASGPAKFDGDNAEDERMSGRILTWISILATQLFALLGGRAATLIGSAYQARRNSQQKPPKDRTQKPAGPSGGGQKKAPRSNVIPLNAEKHSVQAFVRRKTIAVAGGEARGGDLLQAYKRYAGPVGRHMTAPQFRAILTDLRGQRAIKKRTSGYAVLGLQLKSASKAQSRVAVS
jgi:hypothetical protein